MMRNLLKKIADLINEHWIWKTIILFLPSIYLPVIVKYLGDKIGLSDANGTLTKVGGLITIALYVMVLLINILSSYKAQRDKANELRRDEEHKNEIIGYVNQLEMTQNTLHVYTKLLDGIGNICESKFNSIYGYIEAAIKTSEYRKPFNETSYPDKQLKSIAKEIKTCLSEITQPPIDNISVSIAYMFPRVSHNVKWVDQQEIAQCMQLKELKNNKNTTFYKVFREEKNFVFFNDKQKAAEKGNYVFDKKDERHRNIGSIICDEIAIEDEKGKVARAIVTISTYGYKFTNNEEKAVLDNMSQMIEEVILQQFEKRIKIELALLYVKNQYNHKKAEK